MKLIPKYQKAGKLNIEWIKDKDINGNVGYRNIKTGQFRSTLPKSVEEKQKDLNKRNKAALLTYSSQKAKFDRTQAHRRNHSDETMKKVLKVPQLVSNKQGIMSNTSIQQNAPNEDSSQIDNTFENFIVGDKLFRLGTAVGKEALSKLRNYILSRQINSNIRRWNGTVGMEYFNSPNNWYRWTETPEVEGIKEMGKNVTTRDAIKTMDVPSNNWRMAAMDNYSKSKEGYWYKANIPDENMSLRERSNWIRTTKDKPIGFAKKVTSSHGNRSQGAYGKPWDGSLAYSGIGQLGLLEGNVGTHIPYSSYDRSIFKLTPIEEVPIGGRIGFSTGEMPMDNLGWFTKLPNGRFKYNGQILPYKKIEIAVDKKGRQQFNEPTYTGFKGTKPKLNYHLQ